MVVVMEYTPRRKPLLALLILSCLLLPLVSSVPLSRSLSLTNLQLSSPGLEVPVQGVVVGAKRERRSLGEAVARMVVEVNDYPGSGANNRHEPKSPGRP
ncbi:uncharacterized protein LOC133908995 [Phragmites australis]|uniref:uncharacterized protein LOC133908995 n=1 Tax=Phragmites australis TaxID=29695 RepID=UPI002D767642|nr:uncharacterized protein LOC133908995 [Phragmites australis]